jgi:phage I-like protein
MSKFLVTEEDGTGHLPVRDSDDGPLNHHLMGAAWAALHSGYRGNKYQGPNKEAAIAKLKALYKSEGMPLPSESATDVAQGSHSNPAAFRVASLLKGLGKPIEVSGKATHAIPICVTGTWVKNSHKFSITAEDLTTMVANFDKRKNSQVVIDYEHASEQPEVARGGPVIAAGWIHALTLTPGPSPGGRGGTQRVGEGTLFASVEWTPEARRMISTGQYRFFSPAIDWNFPDKETGKTQGATLTSGALTNHPFLEELPPITLTEAGAVLADVSTGYLDAPVKTVSVAYSKNQEPRTKNPDGGKMASKKLSICKMDGEDAPDGAKGHHGIFDGKDYCGHVTASDMTDHIKACMADGFGDLDGLLPKDKGQAGIPGHQAKDDDGDGKMSELLRDSGFRGGTGIKPMDQVLAALKLAATHQLVEQREASRNQLLSLVTGPSSFANDQGQGTRDGRACFAIEEAKQLLHDKKIDGADLLDAIEAKDAIDAAVQKGKVLPKDRAFFFEIAFNQPKKFSEYIAGAMPVVNFATVGMSSSESMPVDQEVDVEAKKLMREWNIGYGKAMKELFKSNPGLERRYRQAHSQQPRDNAPLSGESKGITQ